MIKRFFKCLICFLLIFSVLLSASACSNKKDDSNAGIDEIFSRLEIVTDEESDEKETEPPYFAEHIYVIIPNGCSGELSLKARDFTDKVKEKVGILTSLKYDNELTTLPKNSCEILIGGTNRLASKNAEDELKTNDYLCRWDDGALVICGRSDSATSAAIDRFVSDVLPTSSRYSLMHLDAHFELFNEYEIKKVTLNGYDLYDYVLVYDSAKKSKAREMAEALRNFINSKSGYLLDIVSEADIKTVTRRTLKISVSESADNEAVILSDENGVSLLGNDSYLLSCAVSEFAKNIKNSLSNGNVELKYASQTKIKDADTSFKSVYYFVKMGEENDFSPIYNFLRELNDLNFGILFLGNPSGDLYDALDLNLNGTIKSSKVLLGTREVLVLYDSSKLSKIDIEVDASGKKATAVVETLFGEVLRFVYVVSGAVETVENNSIVFAEQSGKIICKGSSVLTNGTANTSVGNLNYCLLAENNLYLNEDGLDVKDLQDSFCCSATVQMTFSSVFLNDAFK